MNDSVDLVVNLLFSFTLNDIILVELDVLGHDIIFEIGGFCLVQFVGLGDIGGQSKPWDDERVSWSLEGGLGFYGSSH